MSETMATHSAAVRCEAREGAPRPLAGPVPLLHGASGPVRECALAPDAFVDATYERVHGWLYWLCGRRDLAADLTQESFAAFWASLRRRAVREPELWLFKIARNQWRKHCRDRREVNAALPEGGALADPCVGPHERAIGQDERRLLVSELSKLPALYREALVLRFWCDYSHRQIGHVVGAPPVLIRWRIHRACRMLRASPALISFIQQTERGAS